MQLSLWDPLLMGGRACSVKAFCELCRYVVIDNFVARDVAAKSRNEALNFFRQGETLWDLSFLWGILSTRLQSNDALCVLYTC